MEKKTEKILEITLYNDTKTINLMDRFEGYEDDTSYIQLVLRNVVRLRFDGAYYVLSLVIERSTDRNNHVGDITFTELKNGESYNLIRFLTDNLTDDIIQKYNGKNVEWRFDKPYLFRAQNSTNRTGYGWGASNTQYGETTAYVISGAFLGFRNSGFTKIINEYYEQMHFSEYNIKNKSEEPSKIESLSHVPVLIDDTQKEKENMGKRYMRCPKHDNYMESLGQIKDLYSPNNVHYFYCDKCGVYYFKSKANVKPKDTKKVMHGDKKRVFVTNQDLYTKSSWGEYSVVKENDIIKAKKNSEVFKSNIKSSNNEIRIHRFKGKVEEKLVWDFKNIISRYPSLGKDGEIDQFIRNVFKSGINQQCVIRNTSTISQEGNLQRRVEIYNKKSSFLSNVLPEGLNVVFSGRLINGELKITEMKLVENPVIKSDDIEGLFVFHFDGMNKQNCLWDYTNNVSSYREELNGELEEWNDYLDWRKQIVEIRIQGTKYIGVQFDITNNEMKVLSVFENREVYNKISKFLRRNEISLFSNQYSTDRWKFELNRSDNEYRNDFGIELSFVREGKDYSNDTEIINDGWDINYSDFKKYKKEIEDVLTLKKCLNAIHKNYKYPIFKELVFDLPANVSYILDHHMRRYGTLKENIVSYLSKELYADGFLATSQIGDFVLIKRLKSAVLDLSKGKTVATGLDQWLFDITKSRTPKVINDIKIWQNPKINEKQKCAVNKIMAAPDVCLIQGPPGTGKTTVIAEAIYQTVVQGKRVLVASQANLAVDNALERLISNPKIRAIRLGNSRKIDSSVNNITDENVLETFYSSIISHINSQYIDPWKENDKLISECDSDLNNILLCEEEMAKCNGQISIISSSVESLMKQIVKDNPEKLLNNRQDKIVIRAVKNYLSEKENDDSDVVCFSSSLIEEIWLKLKDVLDNLKGKGIIISKVDIDCSKLSKIENIENANSVLQYVFKNIKRVYELSKENGSRSGDTTNSNLEMLKVRESLLKEKVLNGGDLSVIEEWRNINEEIKKCQSESGAYSEKDKSLFFDPETLENEVTDELITEIISKSATSIESSFNKVISLLDAQYDSIIKSNEESERNSIKVQNEIEEMESVIAQYNKTIGEDSQCVNTILEKYHCTRKDISRVIEEKKNSIEKESVLDREKWEPLFDGFIEWVDNIPDYTQEKDIFLRTFINGCNVVGVSCTENARTLTEAGFNDFDVVIIDEVSKATPPELLIPMLRGRKIVLVGDHRQLPPLFNEHEKSYSEMMQQQVVGEDGNVILTMEDFQKYKNMVTSSLFQSYFENASDLIKETLTYQYRMHKDIMNVVNLFYDGYLKDGNEEDGNTNLKCHDLNIRSSSGTAMILPERHAYWFDSSYINGLPFYEERKKGSTSAENYFEAYTIVELLKKMEVEYSNKTDYKTPVSVGVISFYFDQVSLLRKLIKKNKFHAISVETNTVDRFQGKEKEIIIVSLVRNVQNSKHNTDSHIAAFQRINVAFSRAQNLLIVLGAKDMYAPQPVVLSDMNTGEEKTKMVYKEIIEMMDMNGTLFNCDDVLSEDDIETVMDHLLNKEETDKW